MNNQSSSSVLENSELNELLEMAYAKKMAKKNLKKKPIELSASIASIKNSGIVTLAFNKDVFIIKNLTLINSEVLRIKSIPGIDSDPNDLNITSWNVTSKFKIRFLIILEMEARKILIKLEF